MSLLVGIVIVNWFDDTSLSPEREDFNLWEKLKLRENLGTELQQNQRTLQNLKIRLGCRSSYVQVSINCLQIIEKPKTLRQLKKNSFFLAFNFRCFMNMGPG